MLDFLRISGLVVAWQEVCHEFKLLLSRMEKCSGVYLFFGRAGTLVIGRRAENKARQQSAIACKGRCKGNSADVQGTIKFYKTGIYILLEPVEKMSILSQVKFIQNQAPQENSDDLERASSRTEFT